jgi:hypothetical protein
MGVEEGDCLCRVGRVECPGRHYMTCPVHTRKDGTLGAGARARVLEDAKPRPGVQRRSFAACRWPSHMSTCVESMMRGYDVAVSIVHDSPAAIRYRMITIVIPPAWTTDAIGPFFSVHHAILRGCSLLPCFETPIPTRAPAASHRNKRSGHWAVRKWLATRPGRHAPCGLRIPTRDVSL